MISKKCSICGKVIEGYKVEQVDYLLKVHEITQHAKPIKLKES